jgi:hypothetical protein
MFTVNLPACHLRNEVPLLGSVVQTNSTALNRSHAMMNDFYSRILLIVESSVKTVAEDQHVDSLSLEILLLIELQVLCHARYYEADCAE